MDNKFLTGYFWSALILVVGTLIGFVLVLAGAILALVFWNLHWLWVSAGGVVTVLFACWATAG